MNETMKAYNKYAEKYEEKTKNYANNNLLEDIDLFLEKLNGKKILDLWSWPWRDSLIFKERWFNPICIDFSKEMIWLCKQKWLEAYEMNFENMTFDEKSFNWVWAYTSLLHITKSKIEAILESISKILLDEWIFYLWMREWDFEWFKESPIYPESKRFFSFYRKDELEVILSKYFDIINFSAVETDDTNIYINFLCKKK